MNILETLAGSFKKEMVESYRDLDEKDLLDYLFSKNLKRGMNTKDAMEAAKVERVKIARKEYDQKGEKKNKYIPAYIGSLEREKIENDRELLDKLFWKNVNNKGMNNNDAMIAARAERSKIARDAYIQKREDYKNNVKKNEGPEPVKPKTILRKENEPYEEKKPKSNIGNLPRENHPALDDRGRIIPTSRERPRYPQKEYGRMVAQTFSEPPAKYSDSDKKEKDFDEISASVQDQQREMSDKDMRAVRVAKAIAKKHVSKESDLADRIRLQWRMDKVKG